MKHILFIFITIFLCLTPILAHSEEQTRYKIELIVFKQLNQHTLGSETWPSHPPLPATNDALVLKPYQDTIGTYELLPKVNWQLSNIAATINKSADYALLLHQAWYQPITAGTSPQAIHIFAKPTGNYQMLAPIQEQGFSLDEALVKSIPFDTWQLNGVITFSKQNYFHINTDLILDLPTESSRRPAATPRILRMKQHRRLSPNELYYLDHPLLGVLVTITEDKEQKDPT